MLRIIHFEIEEIHILLKIKAKDINLNICVQALKMILLFMKMGSLLLIHKLRIFDLLMFKLFLIAKIVKFMLFKVITPYK